MGGDQGGGTGGSGGEEPIPCKGKDCNPGTTGGSGGEEPIPCKGKDCNPGTTGGSGGEEPIPCKGKDCNPGTTGGGGGRDNGNNPTNDNTNGPGPCFNCGPNIPPLNDQHLPLISPHLPWR